MDLRENILGAFEYWGKGTTKRVGTTHIAQTLRDNGVFEGRDIPQVWKEINPLLDRLVAEGVLIRYNGPNVTYELVEPKP